MPVSPPSTNFDSISPTIKRIAVGWIALLPFSVFLQVSFRHLIRIFCQNFLPSRLFHNPPPQSPSLRLVPQLEEVKATKMPIHLVPLLEWGQQTRVDPFFCQLELLLRTCPALREETTIPYLSPLRLTVIARSEATWRSQLYFYASCSKLMCTSKRKISGSLVAILSAVMKLQVNN